MLPLEAFVKGHLRVIWRVTTKVFDGWFQKVPSKKHDSMLTLFSSFWGSKYGSKNRDDY